MSPHEEHNMTSWTMRRYLYVLGQLLRYGTDAIEATQLPKGQPVNVPNCQATCLSFCTSPAGMQP